MRSDDFSFFVSYKDLSLTSARNYDGLVVVMRGVLCPLLKYLTCVCNLSTQVGLHYGAAAF